MDINKMKKSTKAVYSEPCKLTGAHVKPIYQTSTFVFDDVNQGAKRFAGEEEGYIYTRLGNPTITDFEKKIALLENGEDAVAFASGMAAVSAAIFAFIKKGDHIVAQNSLYGCTHAFLSEMVTKFGIDVDFVDAKDISNIENAVKENTKIIYIESPSNPAMALTDIKRAAKIAKENDSRLIVDNTFMTPYWQRPLELGADLVLHSATKYIGGHGDVIAGILVGNKEDMSLIRETTQKDIGGILSPFDSWLLLRGLKTLGIRMEKHESNAKKLAEFLEKHPKVDKVYYPGLKSHPQYELAKKQAEGFGAMIAFEVKGGIDAGKTVMNNVKLIKLAVSLGTVDSLIQHPASMTHSPVDREDRLKGGITDGLIRFSVGIEEPEDIINDLDNALNKIKI
ncbi:MAG: methionine gamma-lyase [Firmicutes bacterium]|nr:methionine gamma-lyase [Bacillota bacterium]